jgi:RNA polymerase sigma factor (sigma-70 family)
MEPSDEVLLNICRRGDADAWAALVHRYQRLVYSIPRRAGLNEDLAAEVFQRVFTKLVQKLDTIEQPSRLSAWLTTLARRESLRVIQQEARRIAQSDPNAPEGETALEQIIDSNLMPEEQLIALEEQRQIRQAVGSLDERCRRLLTMLYYKHEPPPYTEIAEQLGTSAGSIGPTRARCLEKLRNRLEEQGF